MAKPMYYWNGTAWEAVGPEVPQSPIAYQASAPSTPSTGDLWIDSDQDLDTYQRQLVRYKFIASGGETSLSGADANGATLSYTPGAEQVYLNGALLVRGSDYVATNGTSITSLAALSVNDVVEIFAYVAFNVANTYTQSQVDGLVAPMGLVLINTTSFSAVSSVSFNDVFSATYDHYKVLGNIKGSTGMGVIVRLRVGGSDNSSTNYRTQEINFDNTSFSGQRLTGQTGWLYGLGLKNATDTNLAILEISNPFLTEYTAARTLNQTGSSGNIELRDYAHGINVNTSYTGFSAVASTGTITGSISVYGYKK